MLLDHWGYNSDQNKAVVLQQLPFGLGRDNEATDLGLGLEGSEAADMILRILSVFEVGMNPCREGMW